MALDPNTPDPSLDPYYAWASQPQRVDMPEYPIYTGLQPVPPPPPPPPPVQHTTVEPVTLLPGTTLPPPPPPPPPQQKIKGGPVTSPDEVAASPRLTPEEEAEIQIDPREQANETPAQEAAEQLGHEGLYGAPTSVADVVGRPVYEQVPGQAAPLPKSYDEVMAAQAAAEAGQPLPSMGERQAQDATNRAYANMTDEQKVKFKADRESAMLAYQAAEQHRIERQNMEREQQLRDAQIAAAQKAIADSHALEADAQRLAATHMNPNRYREQRGTFGTIRDVLSSMLLGFGGRPDLGLQQIQTRVNADIDAQRADLENGWKGIDMRRNAIAQDYAAHGDINRAQNAYRLAAYDSSMRELQTNLQQFDPMGATAMRGQDALSQLAAMRAQAKQAMDAQNLKRRGDEAKAELDEANAAKARMEALKLKQQMGAAAAGAGAAATPDVKPVEFYTAMGLTAPPAPMSVDAYKEWATLKKGSNELASQEADATSKAKEQALKEKDNTVLNPATGKPMLDDQGQPVLSSRAADINKKTTAAQQYVDSMSEVVQALNSDPSTIDRKRWGDIQAKVETAKTAMIKYFDAKPSSREMQVADEVIGADFSSYLSRFKDKGVAIASLSSLIDSVKRDQATELKGTAGIKQSPIVDTSRPPTAVKTEIDKLGETLQNGNPAGMPPMPNPFKSPEERESDRQFYARAERTRAIGMDEDHAAALNRLDQYAQAIPEQHSGSWFVTDGNGNDLAGPYDDKAKAQAGADKARKDALGQLKVNSDKAPDGAVRRRAAEILMRINNENIKGSD